MLKLRELVEQNKNHKIYCDMDGVLTDFDRMFYETAGITSEEFRKKHPDDAPNDVLLWETIDKQGGLNFWSHMYWTSDGKMLWEYIKNKNTEILSAPSKTIPEHSKLGKKLWCGRFLGKTVPLNLVRASEKQMFAKPHHILIDDMEKNIERWKKAGGIGILHKSAADTISELKSMGL